MSLIITEETQIDSKQILKVLLRNAFDNIDFSMDCFTEESSKLIQTAKDCGFIELANQMEIDKK